MKGLAKKFWFRTPIKNVSINLLLSIISKRKVHRINISLLIFRRKSFFEKKILNSVVGVFFLLLNLPMTRSVQVCRVGAWYNTSVGCHHCSNAGSDGFESRFWSNFFLPLFRYSLTRSYFLLTKISVFSTKNKGLLVNELFLKNYFFPS